MDIAPKENQSSIEYPKDYDSKLDGFGGWFILIIIGNLLSFHWITDLIDFDSYLNNLNHINITTFFSTIAFIYMILSIILSATILFFIFRRDIKFRIFFIIQLVFDFLYSVFITIYVIKSGPDIEYIIGTFLGLGLILIVSIIWILYVFKSKRIKSTFLYSKIDSINIKK